MRTKIKNIFAILLVLGMVVTATITSLPVKAAGELMVVTKEDNEITARGQDASISYNFRIDDSIAPIKANYVIVTWDPTLGTYDSFESTYMEVCNTTNVASGEIHVRIKLGADQQEIGFKMNFTDVLPEGTTDSEFEVSVAYQDATSPMNPTLELWEVCGKDYMELEPTDVSMPAAATIKLNLPVSINMNAGNPTSIMKGQSGTFAATVTNDDTPPKGITWSVNSTAGSTIDGNGELTIAEGESATSLIVTATSVKDPSKKVTATVAVIKKPGLSLTIDPTSKKLFKNEAHTVNFTAKAVTTEAGTVITYSLAGAKHAGTTIDVNTGELTIDKDETANELVVTATAENNATEEKKVTATAKVSLVEISVVVNPTSATVEKGSTQDFKATVTNDLTNDGVTWKLEGNKSDKTTLVDGKLTVAEDETATDLKVIATSVKDPSKSASADITVVEAPEITITIDPMNAEVKQGSAQDFTALVGNDKKNGGVEWSITGATSKDTKIETNTKAKLLSASAILTVGEDEKVGTVITVEATSVTDGTKVATAKVVVTAKDEITTPTNPTNPTTPTNPSNPSKAPDKTTGTDVKASTVADVKTGDNTNMGLLVMVLGVSALGIFSVVRKKKAE